MMGPRCKPAQRLQWGEETQESAGSLCRQAETEHSGLCVHEAEAIQHRSTDILKGWPRMTSLMGVHIIYNRSMISPDREV